MGKSGRSFVAALCLGMSFCSSAQRNVPMPFWFADAALHQGPTPRDWVQMEFLDLDQDHKVDQVFLDERGLQVAWGLGHGAFAPSKLLLKSEGKPLGFAVDAVAQHQSVSPFDRRGDEGAIRQLPRLFVLEDGPGLLRVGVVEDRVWQESERTDSHGAWKVEDTPYGVLVGPDNRGELLLDAGGVRRKLRGSVLPGARVRVADLNGDGRGDVLLEHPSTHALGVVWAGTEAWGSVVWIPETEGSAAWGLLYRGVEPASVMQMDGKSGEVRVLDWHADSGWVGKAIPSLHGAKQFWSLPVPSLAHCVFQFRQVTNSFTAYRIEQGEVKEEWSLSEWPQILDVRAADWDGDGDWDVVGTLEDAEYFVLPWMGKVDSPGNRGVKRPVVQIWDTPAIRAGELTAVPFPVDVSGLWTSGLPDACRMGPSEWGLHDGRLVVAVNDGILERTPLPAEQGGAATRRPSPYPADPKDPSLSACLGLDYVRYRADDLYPCLASIEPGQWYDVTYVRRKDLTTDIFLNGVQVYQGQSEAVRFQHRTLLVGATYGTNWQAHAPISVDDIRVTRQAMATAEIPAWISLGDEPLRYTGGEPDEVRFRFEGDQPLYAESYDYVWILAPGARLDAGFEGKGQGISTDGMTGYAHARMGEYVDEIALHFRFRWNGEREDAFRSQVNILTMHGMFNVPLYIIPGKKRSEAITYGPEAMDAKWMGELPGVGLFYADGAWGGIGRSGELWMQGEVGWEQKEVRGTLPTGDRRGAPWVWKGQIQAFFGDGPVLYTLDVPERRWTREGSVHPWLHGVERTVQVGDWVFWMNPVDHRAGWLDLARQKVYLSEDGRLDDRWVGAFAEEGAVVLFDVAGERRSLLPPSGDAAAGGEDLRALSCWYNAFFLLILLGMIGLIVWRVRASRGKLRVLFGQGAGGPDAGEENGGSEENGGGEGEWGAMGWEEKERLGLAAMAILVDLEGQTLDTQSFDAGIGIASIETDETRRSRRSRFIQLVNEWSQRACGLDAVVRHQDPSDRRRVLYRVSSEVVVHWRSFSGQMPQNDATND